MILLNCRYSSILKLVFVMVIVGCSPSSSIDLSALTIDQLREKTTDADVNVRWAAIFELGRRDMQATPAIKELTARLEDESVNVRRVASQTIGIILMEHEPPYSDEILSAIEVLKSNNDPDETVQAGIRIALSAVAAKEK